jgi:purine-nucleoside phosphorylase
MPYSEIPEMPVAGVAGHAGTLWYGHVAQVPVACLQGRAHAYEGHPVERVVFGVRLLAALGCESVLLTNAAGGIRSGFAVGDLMLIVDHLNLSGRNPLVGWPCRKSPFVDMSVAYDAELRRHALAHASALGVPLHQGVYAALLGPSYETPAEVRMLRLLGADAVGMSTALEAIALRELGVRVGAMSCITNVAAGLAEGTLNHEEVQVAAAEARPRFEKLLRAWVESAARPVISS